MTDKEQIIIDGTDVSKCEYLTNELEEDGKYYWFCNIAPAGGPDECEYNPECFYKRLLKQLARKTQEYDILQEDYKKLEQRCNELNIFYDEIYSIFSVDDECDITNEEYLLIIKELDRWNKDAFKCWEELNDILHGDYRYYGIDPEYIVDLVKKLRLRFSHKLREYKRYRNALEEIEGIVSKDYYNDTWADLSIKLDKILDIIRKVKEEV